MLCSLLLPLAAAPADIVPVRVDGLLCHPRNLFIETVDTALLKKATDRGALVLRRFPEIGFTLVQVPPGRLQATRRSLHAVFGEQAVSLDRAGRVAYTPNDTYYPNSWHLPAIKADLAWDTSLGPSSPIVAILDTGVKVDHVDLAANMWVNSGEIAGNGVDDDSNGYVDDVNGYDFSYGDAIPDDVHGHGTACAGLAAGVGDNGIGVTGVAPRARIMALKVANNSGYFYDSATIPAYIYGAKMGAKVYSMSYFSDGVSRAEGTALRNAASQGVLPIAAAGNDRTSYPYFPGSYDFVVGVAALNTDLSKAGFSNYGSWVDVAAPGVALYTTINNGGYTSGFAGTSGACPVVAGVAALLFGAVPGATATQVKNAMLETATLQSQSYFGEFSNYGLVNAQAALLNLMGAPIVPKLPKVSWISPIGSVDPVSNPEVRGRVSGRNLRQANVFVKGQLASKVATTKDWIEYRLPTYYGNLAVRSSGKAVADARPPLYTGYAYPLAEASSPYAAVFGGFFETVAKDDSKMVVQRQSDGSFHLQMSFKRLPSKGDFFLAVERMYTNTSVGTERIEIYDWKTASYPYASFITLKEGPAPKTMTRSVMQVKDMSRFVDFEGNVYVRIVTSGDFPADSELQIDTAFIRP